MKIKFRVVISLNTAWNLYNFRSGLIAALINSGSEVIAVAPNDKYVEHVKSLGCHFVPIEIATQGINPFRDLFLFIRFYLLLRRIRPSVFLGYTVKPNIYGSIAAHLLGIPVVNNIAGLGSVFVREDWVTRIVKLLYWLALFRSKRVFFQNEDDRQLFIKWGLVDSKITSRLPGSGINLNKFSQTSMPIDNTSVKFLLISRMLWEKGVGEYVEAAKLLKSRSVKAEFYLLGFLDLKNASAISRDQMNLWVKDGFVSYLGETDDVRPHIASANCIVLPSFYREGVPRTLLEACAIGRPIITTNTVGCRELVDDGQNGYLCKARDAYDLAEKMEWFVALSLRQQAEMGDLSRKKIEQTFDEMIVINQYLDAISDITHVSDV